MRVDVRTPFVVSWDQTSLKGQYELQEARDYHMTDNVYRIAVRVISGEGRINAYLSLVDNATGDPTYFGGQ